MNVATTSLPDVLVLEPQIYQDERGFFFESFNEREWLVKTGQDYRFVQHNHSRSTGGVLRGLHYQIKKPQGKLVRVIAGEVFDVAVDIRRSSPCFGKWFGTVLSAENRRQMWIPPGFAHGFLVTSEMAEFLYLATDYYAPEHERCILWNDPALSIEWPLVAAPLLSAKDSQGKSMDEADFFD